MPQTNLAGWGALRPVIIAAVLVLGTAADAAALTCSQVAGLTALDRNRCQSLERIDGFLPLGGITTPPEAPGSVQPVLAGSQPSGTEGEYYAKAMAIFGQLDYGAGSSTRLAEANRVLRYAMFVGWPVVNPQDIAYNPNVGANKKPWALDNRNVALRPTSCSVTCWRRTCGGSSSAAWASCAPTTCLRSAAARTSGRSTTAPSCWPSVTTRTSGAPSSATPIPRSAI